MTTIAASMLLYFIAGIVGTLIVLWIASRLAWLNASGMQLLGLATAIQLVSVIPRVGWLLAVVVFFLGLTQYLGANGLEATYVFFLALLVQLGLALLTGM
jgi:hypothetical protein